MTIQHETDIAICIASYRRSAGLHGLLRGLSTVASHGCLGRTVQVVIVDNDTSESARSIAEQAASWLPWPVRYVVEPRRGIAQARNRALQEAAHSQFVLFVDDDEVPEPDWLEELVRCQSQYAADITAGPVLSSLPSSAPQWIRRGAFFERERYATGTELTYSRTGNVLIRRSLFDALGGFDESFGLTGGEDSHFFTRAYRAGYRIIWCDEAVVREIVDPGRATLSWILRRAYQGGSNQARVEMTLGTPRRAGLVRALKGAAHMGHSIVRLPFSPFAGTVGVVREFRRFTLGLGMVGGVLGVRHEPYQNVVEYRQPVHTPVQTSSHV
jgi:succinoglycan biosynthesis protein ExoM